MFQNMLLNLGFEYCIGRSAPKQWFARLQSPTQQPIITKLKKNIFYSPNDIRHFVQFTHQPKAATAIGR